MHVTRDSGTIIILTSNRRPLKIHYKSGITHYYTNEISDHDFNQSKVKTIDMQRHTNRCTYVIQYDITYLYICYDYQNDKTNG